MIKVCIISPRSVSVVYPEMEPTHGGAETQLYWFANALAQLENFEVHFILHGEWSRSVDCINKVHYHFTDHVAGIKAKLHLQKLMASINADTYIQQSVGSLAKEVAFHCMIHRKKFIYWIASDFDVGLHDDGFGVTRNRWFIWGMLRANCIIAQTKIQQQAMQKNYQRDTVIIRNAMPPQKLIKQKNNTILWIGRLTQVKQPEVIIEIAKKMPDQKFIMIAPITGNQGNALYEEIKPSIEALDNLKFIPGLPLQEVGKYFSEAILHINTSSFEGFPNTFIQALWAGTPIASLNFEADGIIKKNKLGIEPTNGDLESFIQNIRSLLQDPDRLKQYGENAHTYADEHFNVEKNAKALAKIISELLNEK